MTKCCSGSAMKLGILVTLSAHEKHYTKYARDFLKIINSLRVMDINKTLKKMKSMGRGESIGSVGKYMEEVLDGGGEEIHPQDTEFLGMDGFSWILFTLAALAVGVFVIRKKKKAKKSHKARRRKRKEKGLMRRGGAAPGGI